MTNKLELLNCPITYPVQCKCGHLFLERFKINSPLEGNPVGFCWCGFCRTRLNIFIDNSFEYVSKEEQCPDCKGTGSKEQYIVKNDVGHDVEVVCQNCGGKGVTGNET